MESDLQKAVLMLGGAASISTLIMFFGWLYDRRNEARNLVNVPNISALLSLLGAGFAWAGETDAAIFCYTALWVFLVANFFMTSLENEMRYKVVVFNMIFVTAVLLAMFLGRSIQSINDINSRLIDAVERIVIVLDQESLRDEQGQE